MRQRAIAGLTTAAMVAVGLTVQPSAATAAPPAADPRLQAAHGAADLAGPAEQKRRALRQQAISGVLTGDLKTEKRGASTVVKIGEKPAPKHRFGVATTAPVDEYIELEREQTDRMFVVFAEFGNERHPSYPDQDTNPAIPGPARFDGPLHNQIPEPNRAVDNTTLWLPNYDRQHYQDLYFSTDPSVDSLTNYYSKQSSGRFSVEGTVTDWVRVRFNEARYGRSNGFPCAGIVCNNSYDLVRDGVNQWYADQLARGRSAEEVRAELATFDVWDRHDFDGDGDFNEPDGYIDHFQIVHSGTDQADADPTFGEDALWGHHAFAFPSNSTGPDGNLAGGTQIGDTGLWVGDYVLEAENGGIGVFCHEFANDLGLPDLYDTSGGTNNVNWWSMMAQQKVSGPGEVFASRVNDLDAWSKLQLGWLDYEVVVAGQSRTLELGPHEYNSAKAQGVVVVLPDKVKTLQYGTPFGGAL